MKTCQEPKVKAGKQVGISLPAVEEEVVGVGDRAPVLTTSMAKAGAERGNRDAEVVQVVMVMKSPNLLTLPLALEVAVMEELVVGAPAVDEAIVPLTVKRMVKKARETSEVKAKVAVAGDVDVKVEKTTITTKKTMMKSTATTVRVSMAQSTTAKVEAMETERTGKEKEDVVDALVDVPKPIQAPAESMVIAEETTHMELGRKNHSAQKQNMTRKETQRAAGFEDVMDLATRVALMGAAASE